MNVARRLRAHVEVLLGLVLLGLLGLVVATASRTKTMTCSRGQDGDMSCRTETVTYAGRLRREAIHAPGSVRDVRLEPQSCGKRRGQGIVVIDRIGHEITPFRCGDEAALRAAADELRRFIDDRRRETVSVSPEPATSVVARLVVAILAVVGVAFVVRGIRGRDVSGGSVGWTGRRRGAPVTSPRPSRARSLGLIAGLVALASVISWVATRFMVENARRTQGQLEVRCIYTCRFGGTRCLPGGRYSMWMDPGQYVMEVWSPDPAPRWQPLTFTIRVGDLTRVDCVPP